MQPRRDGEIVKDLHARLVARGQPGETQALLQPACVAYIECGDAKLVALASGYRAGAADAAEHGPADGIWACVGDRGLAEEAHGLIRIGRVAPERLLECVGGIPAVIRPRCRRRGGQEQVRIGKARAVLRAVGGREDVLPRLAEKVARQLHRAVERHTLRERIGETGVHRGAHGIVNHQRVFRRLCLHRDDTTENHRRRDAADRPDELDVLECVHAAPAAKFAARSVEIQRVDFAEHHRRRVAELLREVEREIRERFVRAWETEREVVWCKCAAYGGLRLPVVQLQMRVDAEALPQPELCAVNTEKEITLPAILPLVRAGAGRETLVELRERAGEIDPLVAHRRARTEPVVRKRLAVERGMIGFGRRGVASKCRGGSEAKELRQDGFHSIDYV